MTVTGTRAAGSTPAGISKKPELASPRAPAMGPTLKTSACVHARIGTHSTAMPTAIDARMISSLGPSTTAIEKRLHIEHETRRVLQADSRLPGAKALCSPATEPTFRLFRAASRPGDDSGVKSRIYFSVFEAPRRCRLRIHR